jgi:hypothetical protein
LAGELARDRGRALEALGQEISVLGDPGDAAEALGAAQQALDRLRFEGECGGELAHTVGAIGPPREADERAAKAFRRRRKAAGCSARRYMRPRAARAWVEGFAPLDHNRPAADVRSYRWQHFIADDSSPTRPPWPSQQHSKPASTP